MSSISTTANDHKSDALVNLIVSIASGANDNIDIAIVWGNAIVRARTCQHKLRSFANTLREIVQLWATYMMRYIGEKKED